VKCNIDLRTGKLHRLKLNAKQEIVIHKELNPDFNEKYTGRFADKKYTDSATRETREFKFLEKRVKQERKGAEREIKLDSQFLSRKRAEKRKELDVDRMQKTKDLMQILSVQQQESTERDRTGSKKRKSAFF